MKRLPWFPAVLLFSLALAGEDDPLLRDFGMTRLEPPPPRASEEAPAVDRVLATGWDQLPEALRNAELPDGDEVTEWGFPAGSLLVVANPARLSDAYARIADALEATELIPMAPLLLVLHADDNVSLGCRVEGKIEGPMPMGVHVSPQPARRLLVLPVHITEATRREAALASAAGRLRREAATRGLRPQSRELYLLPGKNQTVLAGLEVKF